MGIVRRQAHGLVNDYFRRWLAPKDMFCTIKQSRSTSTARAFDDLPRLVYEDMHRDPTRFAKDLHEACYRTGFFVLADLPHELDTVHRGLLVAASDFFAVPIDEKQRIDYSQSPQLRGYMRLGAENTAGKRDEREQIEFGSEDAALPSAPDTALYSRLRGPNQWPAQPAGLRVAVEAWLAQLEILSRQLTRAISMSLALPPSGLDAFFEAPHVQAKLVHYPGTGAKGEVDPVVPGELGCGAHSDSGFLTLLLQDEVGGLEVLNGEGRWIRARPEPRSLVCNLGEVLEVFSGGTYRSTVHRVQRPASGVSRLSAPYFWNPSLDSVVTPLARLDSGLERPATGRPAEEVNRILSSYGMNAFKSLARSHPAVFARHHPDLACMPDGSVVRR